MIAILTIAIVIVTLVPFRTHFNSTTVALILLLVILFNATIFGSRPAILASIFGMLGLNYFFLPPFGTFRISDLENWIALAAFSLTAITAGELSARARRRAEEAEASRHEIKRLYDELRMAFAQASQAEAIKQSEKLKSALLDAVTHDLRTPLTSIKASITTLIDETRELQNGEPPVALDRESRREMLEIIDEETDRLNRFIGGLIELARIEAGELHLRRKWGAVDEIVSIALARAKAVTQGHHILVEFENELPVARVDERAVSEVVYTLVENAAKYSPAGTSIRIVGERFDDRMIQLSVEDEGAGISTELRERVFDKFFRATRDADVTTHNPSGTGMGLAIAKGIVEAHDGRIWIESGAGGMGTRVIFTLPIGDDEVVEDDASRSGFATSR